MARRTTLFPPDFGRIAAAVTLSGAIFALALAQWCVAPVYEASVLLAVLREGRPASAPAAPNGAGTSDARTEPARHLDRGDFLFPGIAAAFEEPRFTAEVFAPGPVIQGALRLRPGGEDHTVAITGRGDSPIAASALVWKAAHTLREFVRTPQGRPMFGTPAPPGPARRAAPDRLLWTMGGLLAGLLAAWLLGQLVRFLDARHPSPREIERFLRLPVLCTLPSPASQPLLDRFRFLLPRRHGANVLLFTGVGRDAGKSAAVAQLGKLLSWDGKRVLIVAADGGRSGRRTADRDPENPFAAERIIVSDDPASPDLLPCCATAAETPRQAAAHTNALEQLLLAVSGRYDVILIDAPPAPGSAAPVLFGQLADAVLLVTGGSRGELEQFRTVLYRLYSAVLVPAGVILTRREHGEEEAERFCLYRYGSARAEALKAAQIWRDRAPRQEKTQKNQHKNFPSCRNGCIL